MKNIFYLLSLIFSFILLPGKINALNLKLEFFRRITESDNVLFQVPAKQDGYFLLTLNGNLYLVNEIKNIEIEIGENAISEIVDEKNLLFCSDQSNIVEVSKFGIERKEDIPFPCISPPLKIGDKIYTVDTKGNVCVIQKEKKCVSLKKQSLGEVRLIPLADPKIQKYDGYVIVPYDNEIFALSENLNIRYKILEFEKPINSTKLIGKLLLVSTGNEISLFEIKKEGEAIKPNKIFTGKIDGVVGSDFDGGKIVFTYKKGFGIIENVKSKKPKIFLKPIIGILDISYPIIYGKHFLFIAQFGEKLGRIFGAKKNSLIVVSTENKKIEKEYIIHSFARKLRTEGKKLFFLTEDSTLYVFRIYK